MAQSVERGDLKASRRSLYDIDLDACRWYWDECDRVSAPLHRPEAHVLVPHDGPRGNPDAAMRREVATRDGWRCRYCGLKVVHPDFFLKMHRVLPEDFPDTGPANSLGNAAWRLFRFSPDHVKPLAAGGRNELENLVTSCGACNFAAKGSCTLEELGLVSPRMSLAVADGWDGLVGRPRVVKLPPSLH